MNKKKVKGIAQQTSKQPRVGSSVSSLPEDRIQDILRRHVPGNCKWRPDGKVVPHGLENGGAVDEDIAEKSVPLDQTAVQETFGTDSLHAARRLIALVSGGVTAGRVHRPLADAIGVLRAMRPQNVIEGMLMAQMFMMHEQVAHLMLRSNQSGLPTDLVIRCVNAASSCMDAFNEGMGALIRFRSGGKQQVIVSHVNIAQGAQAAFTVGGDVKGGGGGSDAER